MAEIIKVTFPDGEQICYNHPVDTMLKVLLKIGCENFPQITLETAGQRFVTKSFGAKVKKYAREIIDGWYYINRTDTREKALQLINISRALNLDLIIEVGNFEPLLISRSVKHTKPKNKLQVTMSDGEIIDYDGFSDVLMACIDRLGPRKVSHYANFDLSSKCPLFETTNTTGKRLKVAESLYMAIPQSARDTAKLLHVIACRLKENIKIELLPLASA